MKIMQTATAIIATLAAASGQSAPAPAGFAPAPYVPPVAPASAPGSAPMGGHAPAFAPAPAPVLLPPQAAPITAPPAASPVAMPPMRPCPALPGDFADACTFTIEEDESLLTVTDRTPENRTAVTFTVAGRDGDVHDSCQFVVDNDHEVVTEACETSGLIVLRAGVRQP